MRASRTRGATEAQVGPSRPACPAGRVLTSALGHRGWKRRRTTGSWAGRGESEANDPGRRPKQATTPCAWEDGPTAFSSGTSSEAPERPERSRWPVCPRHTSRFCRRAIGMPGSRAGGGALQRRSIGCPERCRRERCLPRASFSRSANCLEPHRWNWIPSCCRASSSPSHLVSHHLPAFTIGCQLARHAELLWLTTPARCSTSCTPSGSRFCRLVRHGVVSAW